MFPKQPHEVLMLYNYLEKEREKAVNNHLPFLALAIGSQLELIKCLFNIDDKEIKE